MAAVSPYLPATPEPPALTIVTNDQTVYALRARRTPAELAQILPMYTPSDLPDGANPHATAALGVYRACRLANVPVAISAWDDAWQPGSLLYFPLPMQLDRDLVARLRAHVVAGGSVVLEGGAGFYGEDGWVSPIVPAHGLHDLCGVREGEAVYHAQARHCLVPGVGALRMGFRTAPLTVSTALPRAAFPDGQVAVTEATCGNGRLLYLAGSPGYVLGAEATWSGEELLRLIGLETVSLGRLQRIRRLSPHGMLDFVFNYSDQPVTYTSTHGTCLRGAHHQARLSTIPPHDVMVVLEPAMPPQ